MQVVRYTPCEREVEPGVTCDVQSVTGSHLCAEHEAEAVFWYARYLMEDDWLRDARQVQLLIDAWEEAGEPRD